MKKLIIACAVATVAVAGLTSCGKSAEGGNDAFGDSLSTAFGQVNGGQFAQSYLTIPENERAKFDKESILRGIKEVVMTDTADQGFIAGLNIGLNLSQTLAQLEQGGVKLDRRKFYDEFAKAFKADSVDETKLTMLQGELQGMMMRAQEMVQKKQQEEAEAQRKALAEGPEAKENSKAGAEFIAKKMKEDSSIKKTESGLAYKVEAEGDGAQPADGDNVSVIYTGKLIDGTVFDSSNGQAVKFPVNGVIPGFSEALKMMKKGAKYTIYIPGDIAYGPEGTPDGKIKPMSTLVFDVELVDINAK